MAADVLPLLVIACSAVCRGALPPGVADHIPTAHGGGPVDQPLAGRRRPRSKGGHRIRSGTALRAGRPFILSGGAEPIARGPEIAWGGEKHRPKGRAGARTVEVRDDGWRGARGPGAMQAP
ncbi:hypothetical protein GCM10023237_02990 [Streptomyces coeruleoprunus]